MFGEEEFCACAKFHEACGVVAAGAFDVHIGEAGEEFSEGHDFGAGVHVVFDVGAEVHGGDEVVVEEADAAACLDVVGEEVAVGEVEAEFVAAEGGGVNDAVEAQFLGVLREGGGAGGGEAETEGEGAGEGEYFLHGVFPCLGEDLEADFFVVMDVVAKEGEEGAADGAGFSIGDGFAIEGDDGGDVGGGSEDEDFGCGGEFGAGDGGVLDSAEAPIGEECAGELEGAIHGGAEEDAFGAGHAEDVVGVHDAEVFGCAFGEVVVFVEGEGEVCACVGGFFLEECVGEVVGGLDCGEDSGFHGHGAGDDARAAGVCVHEGGF